MSYSSRMRISRFVLTTTGLIAFALIQPGVGLAQMEIYHPIEITPAIPAMPAPIPAPQPIVPRLPDKIIIVPRPAPYEVEVPNQNETPNQKEAPNQNEAPNPGQEPSVPTISMDQLTSLWRAGFINNPSDFGRDPSQASTQIIHGIAALQDTQGLPITGELNTRTASVLKGVVRDQQILSKLNHSTDNDYIIVMIQSMRRSLDGCCLYRASVGNGADNEGAHVIYKGNSVPDLLQASQKVAKLWGQVYGVRRVYFLTDNLSSDAFTALNWSVDRASYGTDAPVPMFVNQSLQGLITADPFFGPPIESVEDDGSQPSAESSDSGTRYVKSITLVLGNGLRTVLHVIGLTPDVVNKFIAKVKERVNQLRAVAAQTPDATILSELRVSDVVSVALARTARDLGISQNELRGRLGVAFQGVQVARRGSGIVAYRH